LFLGIHGGKIGMKWQNTAILVTGVCLLFGFMFGYFLVPDEQKADTLVKCANAAAEVFSMRLWFALTIIFFFTTAVLVYLYCGATQDLKQLRERHDALIDKIINK